MSDINVEIKVFDSVNGLDFVIPLSSDGDSPLSINKELSDINNLTVRKGVQSRKFKIPISKDIATAYLYFNQSQYHNYKEVDGDKDASILVNGNELERGKIRVVKYINKDGEEDVELLFFGNNFEWTELIKNLTLADITWANNSVNYTPAVIKRSWFNRVDRGDEWVFPLENRGGRKNLSSVHTEDFRLALFFYKILERVLQNVGYTFESDFINSVSFKKLVITHFGNNFRLNTSIVNINKAKITGSSVATLSAAFSPPSTLSYFYFNEPINNTASRFNHVPTGTNLAFVWDDTTPPANDDEGLFFPSDGVGKFKAKETGNYNVKIQYTVQSGGNNLLTLALTTYLLKRDANGVATQSITGNSMANSFVGDVTNDGFDKNGLIDGEINIHLLVDETVEIRILIQNSNHNQVNSFFFRTTNHVVDFQLTDKIVEGRTFNISDVVDDQVKVLDIINDVSRLFNFMFVTDPVLKKITIEPRDDFYNSISSAVDITSRIDVSKTIETAYNSQTQKKDIVFSYAKDSADVFVKEYEKEKSITLGQYKHSLPNNFKEGTESIQLKVLAASYPIKDVDSIDLSRFSDAPYTTRYWNEYSTTTPLEMIEDIKPRLLNYNLSTQDKGGGLPINKFRFYDEATDRQIIPFVLPHKIKIGSNVEALTGYNLYFNTVNDQDGRFVSNWSKTITEISTGINSSCFILFDQLTWSQFSFRDVVYIDEPIDIKGYWIIEKLNNYQPENSNLVKCKLLRRVEYSSTLEEISETPPVSNGTNAASVQNQTNLVVDIEDVLGDETTVGVVNDNNGLINNVIITNNNNLNN